MSGSAGLAWAGAIAGRSGVLVGGLGAIDFVVLEVDGDGPYVLDGTGVSRAVDGLQGFVLSIESLGDGKVLAAAFAPFAGSRNVLLVLAPGQ